MLQAGRFRATTTFTPRVAGLPPGSFRVVVSFTPQGAFRPSQTSLSGAPVINIAAGAPLYGDTVVRCFENVL